MAESGHGEAVDPAARLARIRAEIDDIDLQLQALLNRRAGCAQQVAEVKKTELLAMHGRGSEATVNFYRPEREAQVLRAVMERNRGPLPAHEVAHIFREIMSACLALEKPMTIAFLGPEGTFTQAAAVKHFGHAVISRPLMSIDAVFDVVESGEADYGVVPVENSTEGMVTHTLDNFIRSTLKICGEVELPIRLHLLGAPGCTPQDVRRICAHQQALAQCRGWLEKNWPHVEQQASSSNGEAARLAAADITVAAIAGDVAREIYGLNRLASNIQDYADNSTRFLVIGRELVKPSGRDKTSIIVSTHNKPGALFALLEPFQREQLMLTRIDTRPSRSETWTYLFFIEFEGHREDPVVARVLHELEEQTVMLKILGSYPQAVI
ncbi:MAG TPA: prephenate dehydratase [Pseudomonadales bacterium]|nr:prephenate dehydratase [Pseudomonadales bacterium]